MPDYRLSISVARVLVIGIFSFAISGLGSYLLMGYNKKKTILSISGFSLFVAIFLNYILLNYFYMDIISIAIASALTYLIYGFIYLFILFNLSNFRLNKKYIYIIIFHLLKIIIVLIVNIFYQFEIIYFVIVFLFILDTIFEMMTIYAEVSNK
jgi:Na+-driven multidrug efflux pump